MTEKDWQELAVKVECMLRAKVPQQAGDPSTSGPLLPTEERKDPQTSGAGEDASNG